MTAQNTQNTSKEAFNALSRVIHGFDDNAVTQNGEEDSK
jgi:hypothetical protein